MIKAPKGGMVSAVNGQWYNGGEFMPDRGLFCGKAGQRRKQHWDKAAKRNKAFDIGGKFLWQVLQYAGNSAWDVLGVVLADDDKAARAVFSTDKRKACTLLAKRI
jgi:hypothetical protein